MTTSDVRPAYQRASRRRMDTLLLSQGVARASDRLDETRLLQLSTQRPDVHFDDVRVAAEVVAPDPLHDLVLGEDLARVRHEELEQLVLRGGQADLAPRPAGHPRSRVQPQVGGGEHRRLLSFMPSEQGAYSRR